MISEELQIIVDRLKEQGKMRFLDAAEADQIAQFEKKYDIQLPSKYKEWLLFSDGGDFFLPAGVQIYGVTHNPIIDVTNDDRPDDNYIVIGAMSFGDPILCEKDGEKIFIYNLEAGCIEDDEVYEDFTAFLKDLYNLLGIGE